MRDFQKSKTLPVPVEADESQECLPLKPHSPPLRELFCRSYLDVGMSTNIPRLCRRDEERQGWLIHGDAHASNLLVVGTRGHMEVVHIDHEAVREMQKGEDFHKALNPVFSIPSPDPFISLCYYLSHAAGRQYLAKSQYSDVYATAMSVGMAALAATRHGPRPSRAQAGPQHFLQHGLDEATAVHQQLLSDIDDTISRHGGPKEELLDLLIARECLAFIPPLAHPPPDASLQPLVDCVETLIAQAYPS
ncbi:unnamed protein product [Vitrella brassicaformis CCMP3155]|uniref:Uncharacterized protein n=1 Tax=Vitrella brassicaformis (strain CCMP3155) TaxID=1169540 RepID=A0A0G4EMP2_VITBC|nr:unnamed protein product [Vitrella brassicaformis CCMP3155]|eukprot:CEL98078.1 unnamed protein product [Vitrella brassicaformis CCMP3155]